MAVIVSASSPSAPIRSSAASIRRARRSARRTTAGTPGLARVGLELVDELTHRKRLPPGELSFSLRRTHRFQRDTLRILLEYYERYGPVFTFRSLHRPIVAMIGPEANHFVTVSGAGNFSWRKGMF